MSSVSVIIPLYNDAEYISNTVESVLDQSMHVDEIIIVDDASEDDPKAELESFEDDRIQYVSHSENQGGSAARNTGIKLASADYVAFLDADDEWKDTKIEKQVAQLEQRSDVWVATHCDISHDRGLINTLGDSLARAIGFRDSNLPAEGGEELIKHILNMNFYTTASALLVERETVESIGGFDEEFQRHQDWEFLIRVLKEGKLAYVNEQLVIKHGTGRPTARVHEEAKELFMTKFDDDIRELEREGYRITHTHRFDLARLYIEDGEFREGFKRLKREYLSGTNVLAIIWSVAIGTLRLVK